jgi:hypothetical protein
MASAIRQMTGVGGDVRKIARLLQKKAPPGHMLAYINQEEADLLKARGGSGKPHEDTGVPSFEVGEETDLFSDIGLAPSNQGVSFETPTDRESFRNYESAISTGEPGISAPAVTQPGLSTPPYQKTAPESNYERYMRENSGPYQVAPGDNPLGIPLGDVSSAEGTIPFAAAAGATKPDFYAESRALNAGTPTEKSFFEGMTPETKARLGIGGLQAVIGAYQTQQAAEQGRKAKEEMAAMAAPYQQQGKRLIEQAQKGELSPVGQQQLQAVQAQAAQGAQARGGVGAQQAQAQVEAYRQQLLQGQYDYGLKVAGLGDQIMTGAIKTGIQADQYVNQLTSNYYNNIARALYGQAPQVSGQQPASTTQAQ